MVTNHVPAMGMVSSSPPRFDPKLLMLQEEIRTYRRELPRLLERGQEGKFALIKGKEVVSVWDTFSDAMQAGCDKFGMDTFLAQPIDEQDLTRVFPKEFDPQDN